jgi:hypothetical protein
LAPHRTTPDEPDLAEYPEVLRDLRLRDYELVNDCSDWHFPSNQHVKDLTAVALNTSIVAGDRTIVSLYV